jgi:hypothetical protein
MKPTIRPTIKQELAWKKLMDKTTKYLLFGGGAGGGKTWLACEWLLTNCYIYPGTKWFMGRNELKRLMASSYVSFTKVCKYHDIPKEDWKLNGQYNYIEFKNGSRIDLLDLAYKPTDEMYERLGSLEYTGGFIEEVAEVKFKAFDVLKSRIGRHLNKDLNITPKMLLTCNPNKNWLYRIFYKPWKKGILEPKYAFIQSLYKDNPFTADEYEEALEDITDYSTKQRLKHGNWEYDDDDNALLTYDAIQDLFTNTLEENTTKYLTIDVARFGKDSLIFKFWNGYDCYRIEKRNKQGIDVTTTEVKEWVRQERIPMSHVGIDEVGVGGGLLDNLHGAKGFIANSSALENPDAKKTKTVRNGTILFAIPRENYASLKDQCGYMLAGIIEERKMRISAKIDSEMRECIEEELGQLKRKDADKDGKLKLIPKDEIKENIGRSPDYLDTLMIRMMFDLIATSENNEFTKLMDYNESSFIENIYE